MKASFEIHVPPHSLLVLHYPEFHYRWLTDGGSSFVCFPTHLQIDTKLKLLHIRELLVSLSVNSSLVGVKGQY